MIVKGIVFNKMEKGIVIQIHEAYRVDSSREDACLLGVDDLDIKGMCPLYELGFRDTPVRYLRCDMMI
jgi:hypothetical protein